MLGLKEPVWLALLSASLTMGFIGAGLRGLVDILLSTASSSTALDLVVVTFLIAVLVDLYRVTGFLTRLGEELVKSLKKPKLIAIIVPAIMGLLPVPGGALMSAPVVGDVCDRLELSKKLKLFINVWFRHVIFMVYPLSVVLITTASLAGVNMWSLIAREIPIAFSMIIVGYILSFRGTHKPTIKSAENANATALIRVFSPMLIAIIMAIVMSPILDGQLVPLIPLTRYSMVLGLVLAIALLVKLSGVSLKEVGRAAVSRITVELVIASFAAILLRDTFMAVGGPQVLSGIITLRGEVEKLVLLILVPFAVSLATGSPLTGGVFAISVFKPILNLGIRETSLIYASNMVGYLASPAHLCYIYTAQYFEASLTSAYREMFIATATTLAVAVGMYFL